ncbi:hypothetical protein QBC45DRAFT_336130, partial [Copromyces sp. CBS 386.78]
QLNGWMNFLEDSKTEFRFCLYGVFYRGHKDRQVAAGTCFYRTRHPPTFIKKAMKCIRFERCEDGKFAFYLGEHIGHRPDPGRWES